jgi:hypothetical protein
VNSTRVAGFRAILVSCHRSSNTSWAAAALSLSHVLRAKSAARSNSRYRGQFLANRDMRLPIQMTVYDIVGIPEV